MPDFEVIAKGRRYVLGEGPDYFGIWDAQAEDQVVERFPPTEEGFELARRRFGQLKRHDRLGRVASYRVLVTTAVVVAVLWVLIGIFVSPIGLLFDSSGAFEVLLTADVVLFRLAIGALILLAMLLLLRWQRGAQEPKDLQARAPSEAFSGLTGTWDTVLGWTLVTSLTVWILSAFATHIIFFLAPETASVSGGGLVTIFEKKPTTALKVASLFQDVAFRVWVAAFVLLLIRWGRVWLSRRPGAET